MPEGLKHYALHTNIGFIPGRITVESPEDAKDVAATIQNEYTLTPLSRWGTGQPNPTGEYNVLMRAYGPEGDILTGKYTPPPVTKVK